MLEPSAPVWSYAKRLGYPVIVEVAPAPSGPAVAYVVEEPVLSDEKSEFVRQIYLAAPDTSEPRQLTFGEHDNASPRWSPDGRHLAFLSRRSGKANVYVLAVGGGEAWP
jgi:Tol biopolymer transport system component